VGAELFYFTKTNNLRLDEFCAISSTLNFDNQKKGDEHTYNVLMHPCAANHENQLWEYTELVSIFIDAYHIMP
jgi:hypothetical protein